MKRLRATFKVREFSRLHANIYRLTNAKRGCSPSSSFLDKVAIFFSFHCSLHIIHAGDELYSLVEFSATVRRPGTTLNKILSTKRFGIGSEVSLLDAKKTRGTRWWSKKRTVRILQMGVRSSRFEQLFERIDSNAFRAYDKEIETEQRGQSDGFGGDFTDLTMVNWAVLVRKLYSPGRTTIGGVLFRMRYAVNVARANDIRFQFSLLSSLPCFGADARLDN